MVAQAEVDVCLTWFQSFLIYHKKELESSIYQEVGKQLTREQKKKVERNALDEIDSGDRQTLVSDLVEQQIKPLRTLVEQQQRSLNSLAAGQAYPPSQKRLSLTKETILPTPLPAPPQSVTTGQKKTVQQPKRKRRGQLSPHRQGKSTTSFEPIQEGKQEAVSEKERETGNSERKKGGDPQVMIPLSLPRRGRSKTRQYQGKSGQHHREGKSPGPGRA
jgi:hypothetical protein